MRELEIEPGFVVLLDDEDFYKVSAMKWRNRGGYAYDNGGDLTLSMHRLVMGFPNQSVDHIDRNPRNNQKSNLRLCDHSQNGANQKKRVDAKLTFKGIVKQRSNYYARVKVRGITHRAGPFVTQQEAAEEYDRMTTWHHGEYAATNKKLGLL